MPYSAAASSALTVTLTCAVTSRCSLTGIVELAELLERLFEMHLAAVDVEALGFELVRDVGGGDRAEEVIVLAHLALEDQATRR